MVGFYEEQLYTSKELEIKHRVQNAIKIIDTFYQKSKRENIVSAIKNELRTRSDILLNILTRTHEENINKMSCQELLNMLKNIVRNPRYGQDGYFWINDKNSTMIMHPIKPALNGKDLSKFADPNGKKTIC